MLPSVGVFGWVHCPRVARRMTSTVHKSSPVDALEYQCPQFKSDPIWDTKPDGTKQNKTKQNNQSINIRSLRHDKMQAGKLKDKHDNEE